MRTLARSIALQLLLLACAVVVYNRIVYAMGSISSRPDFSTWAAPLRAVAIPVSIESWRTIARWLLPIAIAGVWISISIRTKRPFARQLALAVPFAFALNIAVAMMDDGVRSIAYPFTIPGDYWPESARVSDPIQYLRDYPTTAGGIHPRTHPPGAVIFLWAVRTICGDNVAIAALVSIALSALTIVPAAQLARKLYDERIAKIVIALFVVTPNLVLFGATCMDGVFALVLVTTAWSFFRDDPPLIRGLRTGVLLALSTFFTFATSALVFLFVAWWIRRKRDRATFTVLAIAAITMFASCAILYVATGCNLIACLRASIAFDRTLMANVRAHYWDMTTTNLLAFVVGSGLIASTLWIRSVARRDPLAVSLAITVPILSFSTLFTRETERVWMFFTPLLLIGAAVELARTNNARWFVPTLILLFAQTWTTQFLLYTFW